MQSVLLLPKKEQKKINNMQQNNIPDVNVVSDTETRDESE